MRPKEIKHGATEDWGYVQAHVTDEEFRRIMADEYGENAAETPIKRGYARWVPTASWTDTFVGDCERVAVMCDGPGRGAFLITYSWWG